MNCTENHYMKHSVGIGQTGEELWAAAVGYFMWCESKPIYKPELIRTGELAGTVTQIPFPRPFSLEALCIHLGVTSQYIRETAKNPNAKDFYFVAQRILQVIYTQVYEHAIVGIYNAPLVKAAHNIGENDSTGKLAAIVNIQVIEQNAPLMLTNEQDAEDEKSKEQKSNL